MREYKGIYKYEQYKRCSQIIKRKTRETNRGLKEKALDGSDENPRFHCATLISNMENPQAPSSRIWTMQIQES